CTTSPRAVRVRKEVIRPILTERATRSNRLAPKFCPTRDSTAIMMERAGKTARVSRRDPMPMAALAEGPKSDARRVRTKMLTPIRDCETMEGRPTLKASFKAVRSFQSGQKTNLSAVPLRKKIQNTTKAVRKFDPAVANPAPATPKSRPVHSMPAKRKREKNRKGAAAILTSVPTSIPVIKVRVLPSARKPDPNSREKMRKGTPRNMALR